MNTAAEGQIRPLSTRGTQRAWGPCGRRGCRLEGSGLGPEALHRAVDPEERLPEGLRDGHETLHRAASVADCEHDERPEMMMSGPPTRPSHAIFRGTNPQRYIR